MNIGFRPERRIPSTLMSHLDKTLLRPIPSIYSAHFWSQLNLLLESLVRTLIRTSYPTNWTVSMITVLSSYNFRTYKRKATNLRTNLYISPWPINIIILLFHLLQLIPHRKEYCLQEKTLYLE